MTRSSLVLAIIVAIAAPATARAGIQNVQSALATEPAEGLSGNVTASVDWRRGNVSFLFLAATAAARYRIGKHMTIALVSLDRKTSGEQVIISRTFEHLRHRYQLTSRLLGEAFIQHEFDGVKRLTIRGLVGAGPRYEIIDENSYKVGLGVAYMLEYEQIKDDIQADAGDTDLAHRISSYLFGTYELDERLQLIETFYVQPRIDDGEDIRLLNETSIVIKATRKISLSTSLQIAYDRRPPLTVKRLDTALKTTITFAW